jgi:hypothetical protein
MYLTLNLPQDAILDLFVWEGVREELIARNHNNQQADSAKASKFYQIHGKFGNTSCTTRYSCRCSYPIPTK